MKHARDMLEVATEEPPMVTGFELAAPEPKSGGGALSGYVGTEVEFRGEPVTLHESPFERVMRLASDPNFDVEKLDRLVAMIRDQERDKQRQAFNRAMVECQKAMEPIARNAKNTQTNSTYATLDAVNEKLVKIYTDKGFSVSFGTDQAQRDKCYGVTALVAHDDGYERLYRADIPMDVAGIADKRNKTDTHGFGSSMSYGRRYLLYLIFNISTRSEDKDGNQPGDTITEQQYTELRQKIEAWDVDEEKLLAFLKIEELPLLPAKRFDAIMRDLKADAKKRGFKV